MYPSQTSLIPVTVSLVKYFETGGLQVLFENFTNWYMGTTPYRYLIGPILPLLASLLNKLLSDYSVFSTMIDIIAVSFVISAAGWGILVNKIQKNDVLPVHGKTGIPSSVAALSRFAGRRLIPDHGKSGYSACSRWNKAKSIFRSQGIIVMILLLILPWRYFSALALTETSAIVAKNLVPLGLILFWMVVANSKDKKALIGTVLITSFILLVNTTVLLDLIVGFSALVLVGAFKKGKIKSIEKGIKKGLLLLTISLGIVTLWYTPTYWWVLLANPSIGGASGIKVIFQIINTFKIVVPLIMAVLSVYIIRGLKNRLEIFTFVWAVTFLLLTVFRLFSDLDFWMDWTSWFLELEVGIALIVSQIIFMLPESKNKLPLGSTLCALLLLSFFSAWRAHLAIGSPKLISDTVPTQVSKSLMALSEIAEDKRVFLSGSTVFWADALYGLNQVRGGNDRVAVHPTWNNAAYQLREGKNPELAKKWLNELGVSYVLVHGADSLEFYHDFKNLSKWDEIGERVWEEDGDIIYKITQ